MNDGYFILMAAVGRILHSSIDSDMVVVEVEMMPEEIKEEYTETDINMWGMEIKMINDMLKSLSNMFLMIHNPPAIKQQPNIPSLLADIEMELTKIMSSYVENKEERESFFFECEKVQDEAELIYRDYSNADETGEDYDNPEQLWNFYKMANKMHRRIFDKLNELGLRIPYVTRHDVDAILKKKRAEREKVEAAG